MYVVAPSSSKNPHSFLFQNMVREFVQHAFPEFTVSGKKMVPSMLVVVTVHHSQNLIACNRALPYHLSEIICRPVSVILSIYVAVGLKPHFIRKISQQCIYFPLQNHLQNIAFVTHSLPHGIFAQVETCMVSKEAVV